MVVVNFFTGGLGSEDQANWFIISSIITVYCINHVIKGYTRFVEFLFLTAGVIIFATILFNFIIGQLKLF